MLFTLLLLLFFLCSFKCLAQLSTDLQITNAPSTVDWMSVASASAADFTAAVALNTSIFVSYNGFDWINTTSPAFMWRAVALSSSGQRVCAAVYGGGIYISNNYGMGWNLAYSEVSYWMSVSSSASGQYLFAVSGDGPVIASGDYGVSWAEVDPKPNPWTSIYTSSSGIYTSFVGNGVYGTIVIDMNTGEESTETFLGTGFYFYSVTGDLTGQVLYAAESFGTLYYSTNFGTDWTELAGSPTASWFSISSSGNGQTIYAVSKADLYYSTNGGNTWAQSSTRSQPWSAVCTSNYTGAIYATTFYSGIYSNMFPPTSMPSAVPSADPTSQPSSSPTFYFDYTYTLVLMNAEPESYTQISSSDSGQYLFASASTDGIFASGDYGNTWKVVFDNDLSWTSVACSSTGQYVYAAYGETVLYNSSSFGSEWTSFYAGSAPYRYVTTSNTGQYVYAASPSDEYVAYSSDYGHSWHYTLVNIDIGGVACSGDGQYVTVIAGDYFYASSNSGESYHFLYVDGVDDLAGIAMSDSGQYQAAVFTGIAAGGIAVSSDYGQVFTVLTSPPSGAWNAIACDATGQYLFATYSYISNSGVYVSLNFGEEWVETGSPSELWSSLAVSANGSYLAGVVSGGGMYTNQYNVPSSLPSTLPSGEPSTNPSTVPSSQPSSVPSLQPHTAFPSSQPSVQPSNQPTNQPSAYPTYIPDTADVTAVVASQSASTSYVVNNLGCDAQAFVTASVLVSYLYVGSGGFLEIYAGSGKHRVLVSDYCAPVDACGSIVCAVNTNITSAMSCSGGGSVTLYATTVNTTSQTGVDIRCTYEGTPGLQYVLSFTVSVNPLPTLMPTPSPSVDSGADSFIFQASPNTPFYIIVMCTILMIALGVFSVRVKDKSNLFKETNLSSTCVDLAMIGYHLSSELFYVIVLFDEGLRKAAILIVVIRALSTLVGIYLLLSALGAIVRINDLSKDLHQSFVFKNTTLFSAIILLMMLEQTMVRYLPWNDSSYTLQSRGFPNQHVFKVCILTKFAQLISTIVIQVVVIATYDASLFTKGANQISRALVLLYLISSSATIIFFTVTNVVRLRVGEAQRRQPSASIGKEMVTIRNPIIVRQGEDTKNDAEILSLRNTVTYLSEREALLSRRVEDLESLVRTLAR